MVITNKTYKKTFFLLLSTSLRIIWLIIAAVLIVLGLLAFYYQLPDNKLFFYTVSAAWCVLGIFGLLKEWQRPFLSRCLLIIMFAVFAVWWSTIKPSLDRDWAPELSRGVSANFDETQKNIVHIHNIRDSEWITPDKANNVWKDETYNIDDITGLDVYLSYWMGPYIAHTLVGFDFADGRHLVFSAEIRREKNESFSAIGGFFKEFELIMIAATEEDVIKLRTDIRREDVYRYAIKVPQEKMRELFLRYLDTANSLDKNARFYNTVTANCTTVVFDMAHIIAPSITLDWRVILSGQLPAYLYDHKVINTQQPLSEIIEQAHLKPQNNVPRREYSRAIRHQETTESN